MDDNVLKFEDYEDHPGDDDLVRCVRCGKRIPAISTRCPACRVHFQGEAQDFYHSSEAQPGSPWRGRWVAIVAILLVITLIVGALGLQ